MYTYAVSKSLAAANAGKHLFLAAGEVIFN